MIKKSLQAKANLKCRKLIVKELSGKMRKRNSNNNNNKTVHIILLK